jgi:putative Holliday junction resolvase
MRVLAVDLGSKRIGIAVSDALGITTRPLETIRRLNPQRDIACLKAVSEEVEAESIVVGLPLRMDGTIGDAAAGVLRFIELLRAEVVIPVFTQDERLTSYEAEQIMMERRMNREQRKKRSDEFAALLILEDFLAKERAAAGRT